MQERVYRTPAVLCRLVARFPVGTNLGLVHPLWRMASGRRLGPRGAGILLQAERVPRFVARARKNFVARRAAVPAYAGKGRPPERGDWVRPLARAYRGKAIAATPPDRTTTWQEGGVELRGETWLGL